MYQRFIRRREAAKQFNFQEAFPVGESEPVLQICRNCSAFASLGRSKKASSIA